jgi:hypothetical protein
MVNGRAIRCVCQPPAMVFAVALADEEQDLFVAKLPGWLGPLAADDHAGLLAGMRSKGVPSQAQHGHHRHTFKQPRAQIGPLFGANLVVRKHDGQAPAGLEKFHAAFEEQNIALHAMAARKLICVGVVGSHVASKGRIGQNNVEAAKSWLLPAHEVFQDRSWLEPPPLRAP